LILSDEIRIAFYGGSFDPPHRGHLAIAEALVEQFELGGFVFIPAFHAPHKKRQQPTPAYDRYAMLCLATQNEAEMSISRIEIEAPERPFSVDTLGRLNDMLPRAEIYFVMGSDSWNDITTWREWKEVLSLSNHIVVTRPGYEIETGHVTDEIASRIVDLRGSSGTALEACQERLANGCTDDEPTIYFTDRINMDISATTIREGIRSKEPNWDANLSAEVANYIEKYQIYS
jgi:nicotinate-nucleotide adenylyltransferase